MASRKKKPASKSTKKQTTRGSRKKPVAETPSGPLTMEELVDKLCPKIEFENEEELTIPDHPLLGSKLRWIPTPVDSSEPMRQLYYILTDTGEHMSENERFDLMGQLESHYSTRTPTSKALLSLSQQMDTNIIVIENKFNVITPDMKTFNTARHTVLTYYDGSSYHSVEEPKYILATLMEEHPGAFKDIVRHDVYQK
jgi:hypothetical protein